MDEYETGGNLLVFWAADTHHFWVLLVEFERRSRKTIVFVASDKGHAIVCRRGWYVHHRTAKQIESAVLSICRNHRHRAGWLQYLNSQENVVPNTISTNIYSIWSYAFRSIWVNLFLSITRTTRNIPIDV